MVNISLRVLARPDASKLPQIYRVLGTDYDERVLPSICNEVCLNEILLFRNNDIDAFPTGFEKCCGEI